jgi:recombination protein RecT
MPARTRPKPDQEPKSTAVAVVDPARELVSAVESRRPQLAALLSVDPSTEKGKALLDRFVTVALHAATSRPDILRATKESIVEAIRDSAMLGLEPVGATGDGAIIVYDEKVKAERPGRHGGTIVVEERVPTARFAPMYRGLLKLARRSEQIAHIDAHVVYQGDEIELDLGSNPFVKHYPVLDGSKRGKYVGAYAVAELVNGRRYVEWMTEADIEVVRKTSRAKDAMAWSDFWPEMARKTVLRRLMKRLPLETLAEHALRIENEAEERAIAPALAPPEGSDARRRLRSRFEPEPANGSPPGEDGPAEPPAVDEAKKEAEPPTEAATGDPSAAAAANQPEDGEAREICGAPSPYSEGEVCRLEPHAKGTPHQAGEKESWL